MKIAFILNRNKLSGKLTKFFTGCYAYHVAFVDEETGKMWDMNLLRRRRVWPAYSHSQVLLFDCPVPITVEFLERKLETDNSMYGVLDYLLFAIRPLYHLFGKSTRNAGGVICSEMVNDDLIEAGWDSPWPKRSHPPSPCDMLMFFGAGVVKTESNQ